MKRILAIALTFTMLLAALTGCVAEDITGTITFYSEATLEKNEPVSDTSFELSKEQVKAIKKIIKNVKDWTDDCVVNRLPLYFDGEIKFSDSEFVYYFSYDSRVIYYDHYFSVISDDEMQEIKDNRKRKECEQNPSGKRLPITLTIAETLPSCVAFEYKDGKPYCFYAYDTEGHLYRVFWNDFTGLNKKDVVVVDHNDDIKTLTYDEYPDGGWTPQYEVTATNIKMEKRANDNLALHIQISSGNKTIFPFGCLMWSKIDNGNGTFSESIIDKYNVIDLVSGKTTFSVTDIPKLVLSDKVSYFVQVNGRVEKVYLLTPNGDTYIKTETTFDALSNLTDGTYYVVVEVLLSGNCDPDAPQNSYRYEDVFCLVVGEDDKPVTSEMITYSAGDVLSQTVLNNAEKQIILNILDCDKEWISDIPECDWICRFSSSSVNIGYCDCGTLSDFINNRSRKLTDEEKENIESLISQLNEEPTHSGYEVEVELFQYTWDGWGISTKTVGACDVAYNIIDALKAMKETGETVPKISDEVFEIGGGQYAAERGTMWIESGNKIYRLTPDLSQICLVETPFGEGKVLEITDAFKTNVNNAWHYAPYDYYKGTYNKGDSTVELNSVFKSGSTVQLSIKKIHIESGYDPKNTITVELISSVDQEVNIKLHCQQSDDNLAAGDYRTVQLKKGEPTTVDLTFGGWPNFTYWVYIEADFTKAEITINP